MPSGAPDTLRLTQVETLLVGVIAEPVPAMPRQAELSALMRRLSISGLAPIVDSKKRLLGCMSDQDMLLSPEGQLEAMQASDWPESAGKPFCLQPQDTIKTAMHHFAETDWPLIPIVDSQSRYTGQCASRLQLYKLLHGTLRPPRVGGLATPLGVYMTSGYHHSGAGVAGLIATGALFGLLTHGLDYLGMVFYSLLVTLSPAFQTLADDQQMILQLGIMMATLLALLRLSPMSGLHAAEHMTINAIESDLPLTQEVIRTQPREHRRCGTNLMVLLAGVQLLGMSLFFAWSKMNVWGWLLYSGFWGFIIYKYWQPAGLWLQRNFTTKRPSAAQLSSGIRAGQELLEKFQARPHGSPGFWRRIWGSGIPHMIISFLVSAWLFEQLLEWIG